MNNDIRPSMEILSSHLMTTDVYQGTNNVSTKNTFINGGT